MDHLLLALGALYLKVELAGTSLYTKRPSPNFPNFARQIRLAPRVVEINNFPYFEISNCRLSVIVFLVRLVRLLEVGPHYFIRKSQTFPLIFEPGKRHQCH
jgi:hypothetical protein